MSRFTNHTTSSSYLQAPTSSQLPPSSFRGTGERLGLRNSLKKIPSSLFGDKAKKEKERMKIHMDDPTTTTAPRSYKSPAIPAFLSNNASPPRAEKGKLQKKTKTRKGLGEIFGWSSNSSNNSNANPPTITPPIISAPSALVPSPPRVQKENIMPRQARRTSSKSSIPGLAGWTSLRPPAETPARARPSMGADPFGRTDVGAERVDQIQQCGELYERRGSVSSGKALSSKTVDSSEKSRRASVSSGKALSSKTFGSMDRPESISSSEAISTKTVDSDYTIKYQGHAEIRRAKHVSPVPARATLVELPSRNNSTIRRPSVPIPSPRQLASARSAVQQQEVQQGSPMAIKKDKTKSRVWGLLGIRRKSKDLLSKAPTPVSAPAGSHKPEPRDNSTLTPSRVPKRVSSIHALNNNGSTRTTSRTAMPWPPSLHITQPSVDVPTARSTGSALTSFGQGDDFNPGSGPMAALMSVRSMPKRKSLNGLFGLSLKEAEAFKSRHQEPVEEEVKIQESPPYTSRFGGEMTRSNTLRRVASATDKLVDFVTAFELSPASRKTITPMDSLSSIAETIKEAHEGSPTPMRKVKSAVLSIRNASPLRHGPNVSPLKLALHRKQMDAPFKEVLRKKSSHNVFAPSPSSYKPPKVVARASQPDLNATLRPQKQVVQVTVSIETAARTASPPVLDASAVSTSPPHTVDALPTALPPPPRPARRNIFAPPAPQVTAATFATAPISDETVGMGRPSCCASAFTDSDLVEHDVPQDLRDLFADGDHIFSATPSPIHVPGLPQPTGSDRRPVSGRRRRNPPGAALPPSPPTPPCAGEQQQRPRDSVKSEFDFDSEFAKLDQGDQRASFVEAFHRAHGDFHTSHDLPPLPPLPTVARDNITSDQFDDASERSPRSSTDTVVVVAAARRSPFMGTFAFQQHASTIRGSHSPAMIIADLVPEIQVQPEEDEVALQAVDLHDVVTTVEDDTAELAPPPTRRGHRRDESGLSIATMSSIGDVIETGIAGDYTNYFEAQFAADNARRDGQGAPASVFDFGSSNNSHSRQSFVASVTSQRGHRRGHSRNTSIASLASIDGIDFSNPAGPPVSMHNRKRSSYISRNRQSGASFDSGYGRSDWAATHRRNFSDESVMSNMSANRIARPGLGDRMFQLDGGVQLTSITGSPADGYDQDEEDRNDEEAANMSKATFYTAYDGEASFHTALDTSLNGRDSETETETESSAKESDWKARPVSTSSETSACSRDSIFGPGPVKNKSSFLLRPISAITTDSSSNEEDTFVNVARHIGQVKRAPSCIEAQGEETMTPVNIARPRKPRSDRRRHVQLALESDMDTPGLTSPSASEASSRMSLETRFSEGPTTQFFAGHRRQQSSIAVKPQATIKEEASKDNLKSTLAWQELGTIRRHLDWEREADVEYRRARSQWTDSEESKMVLESFKPPTSRQEIADFIAQSAMSHGPLKQQHLPKPHRRKSSLSEARASLSPYGLPLARPPVHGGGHPLAQFAVYSDRAPAGTSEGQPQKRRPSLITKFERTNSATSSHFPSDDEPTSQPSSAIFAKFVRDTPPTPPPVLSELPTLSPFKFNLATGYSPKKPVTEKEKRARVDSEARRQALGWGKRRNSDGPAKVVAAAEPVPKIPLAFVKPQANSRRPLRDLENVKPNASPTKKAVNKRAPKRVPRQASVPRGLRA